MDEYYKLNLEKYLVYKINLNNYEQIIKENFGSIFLKGYTLANNIYLDKLDDSELKYLQFLFSNNEFDNEKIFDFIEKTFARVLRCKSIDNVKIYYNSFTDDIGNFVNDGTLVWKVRYKEKINDDIKKQLETIDKLCLMINKFDEQMSSILNVTVKTFVEPVVVI